MCTAHFVIPSNLGFTVKPSTWEAVGLRGRSWSSSSSVSNWEKEEQPRERGSSGLTLEMSVLNPNGCSQKTGAFWGHLIERPTQRHLKVIHTRHDSCPETSIRTAWADLPPREF